MSPLKEDRTGFTLIEILFVLVVLVIIASISLPNFSKSFVGIQLQTTANDIAYIMRYAQSRAVIREAGVRLVFSPDMSEYRLYQQPAPDQANEIYAPPTDILSSEYNPIAGRWGRPFKVSPDIKVESSQQAVTFYPDGQMDKVQINICHENKCMQISTEERRGHVQVFQMQE